MSSSAAAEAAKNEKSTHQAAVSKGNNGEEDFKTLEKIKTETIKQTDCKDGRAEIVSAENYAEILEDSDKENDGFAEREEVENNIYFSKGSKEASVIPSSAIMKKNNDTDILPFYLLEIYEDVKLNFLILFGKVNSSS